MGQGKSQGAGEEGLCDSTGRSGYNIDGLLRHSVWASYTHIFAPAVPCWATNFVAAARSFAVGAERRRSL